MGLFATALAIGGVLGPLLSGFAIQHAGFRMTFYGFAALGIVAAAVFTLLVPETGNIGQSQLAAAPEPLPE